MGVEIERKFLVNGSEWKPGGASRRIRQGYLSLDPERTVRVRTAGEAAWLNVKGPTRDCTRLEFEYPIPVEDARQLLEAVCLQPIIDKTRHTIRSGAHTWEIDEFHGLNEGLVIAEIELQAPDEPFERPRWLGTEVSGDPSYFNANLVTRPFTEWQAINTPGGPLPA